MIHFLLIELPEEEHAKFEEKFFTYPKLFPELLVLEDELVEAYVCGELSAQPQERFEKLFLVFHQHGENVRFNQRLMNAIAQLSSTIS
ncbi:MAG: hypothetical protein ONA90_05755 [candidate division KSB1 bacterium]|nr:hypothetical protein [candidate division KSB1 bacterium]